MDSLLLGAAGTAFSALIAACGYWFKLLRDRRRTTRHVLYYLLEIRHRLSAVVELTAHFPDGYLAIASEALRKRGIELPEPEQQDLAKSLHTALRTFAATTLEELGREVLVPYGTALLDLAKDDPVLAFTLKGRESLSGPTSLIQALQEPLPPELDPSMRDEFFAQLEGKVRADMLSDVEVVVQLVARRCGFFTGRRVRQLIREQTATRKRVTSGPALAEIVDEMVDQAVPTLAKKRREAELPMVKLPPSLQ